MLTISKQTKIFFTKYKRGFAVLFSIMLASFLITLGISIFSISLKEIQITTSVRDSQIAYYAADSARECALYWDVKKGAFPTCLNDDCSEDTTAEAALIDKITCNGIDLLKSDTNPLLLKFTKVSGQPIYSTTKIADFFKTSATNSILPVADVKITKEWIIANQSVRTTIDSWGHNTGVIGRRVERGIRQINN